LWQNGLRGTIHLRLKQGASVLSRIGSTGVDKASVRELLETLCDAVADREPLLGDWQILHRMSENNIIITNSATEADPRRRLIDLVLAEELDSELQ